MDEKAFSQFSERKRRRQSPRGLIFDSRATSTVPLRTAAPAAVVRCSSCRRHRQLEDIYRLYSITGNYQRQLSHNRCTARASEYSCDGRGRQSLWHDLCDGAFGYGNVFELTPFGTGWTYTYAVRLHGRQRRRISDQQRDFDHRTAISTAPPPLAASQGAAAVWAVVSSGRSRRKTSTQ